MSQIKSEIQGLSYEMHVPVIELQFSSFKGVEKRAFCNVCHAPLQCRFGSRLGGGGGGFLRPCALQYFPLFCVFLGIIIVGCSEENPGYAPSIAQITYSLYSYNSHQWSNRRAVSLDRLAFSIAQKLKKITRDKNMWV